MLILISCSDGNLDRRYKISLPSLGTAALFHKFPLLNAMNLRVISFVLVIPLFLAGCKKQSASSGNKVRIGYIGLTCEAPIYAAYEKGFFQEEGLEPELVKCNWANYKDTLALGGYDITHHLTMYFLKPIEQGLDVRFLAGIHMGAARTQRIRVLCQCKSNGGSSPVESGERTRHRCRVFLR